VNAKAKRGEECGGDRRGQDRTRQEGKRRMRKRGEEREETTVKKRRSVQIDELLRNHEVIASSYLLVPIAKRFL